MSEPVNVRPPRGCDDAPHGPCEICAMEAYADQLEADIAKLKGEVQRVYDNSGLQIEQLREVIREEANRWTR